MGTGTGRSSSVSTGKRNHSCKRSCTCESEPGRTRGAGHGKLVGGDSRSRAQ